MKKLMIVATVAIMALGSAFARAADAPTPPADGKGMMGNHHGKMMEKMDTDKDGIITRAEHDAFSATRFTEMDTDKDGKVTKEELEKHRQEKMAKWGGKGRHHCEDKDATPPKE